MFVIGCEMCGKNLKNLTYLIKRRYHSDKVYGFKERTRRTFTVPKHVLQNRAKQSNFFRLVTAYRQYGHRGADINPVSLTKNISIQPELDLGRYDLNADDVVDYVGLLYNQRETGTIGDAVSFLDKAYCKTLAVEFLHLETEEETEWFGQRTEESLFEDLSSTIKFRILKDLLHSQIFDQFLATKFTSVKRYGCEGAESLLVFFNELFHLSINDKIKEMVIGMPHRGRLNFLTGMLNFPPVKMFAKLKGKETFPAHYSTTGDVLSHLIASTDVRINNQPLHVSLLYNPSHLEAVNPVCLGKTRAKQMDLKDGDYGFDNRWSDHVLNVVIHGDGAITGQGINQECLALSATPHFEIGGTVHLVVNNQLGFTTPAERGRSSRYCTDLAKMISAPIIHVNGDFPESVWKATRIAFDYQRKFRKDVFIDMNCYRQWGHNELDDPTFTNPILYQLIRSRRTVPDTYAEKLIQENLLQTEDIEDIKRNHKVWLDTHLKAVENYQSEDIYYKNKWQNFSQAREVLTTWDTGVNLNLLTLIGTKSIRYPSDFTIHPTLLKMYVKKRLSRIGEGLNIDWATAEALAFGSLLYEGYNVRISGQDVGRGTFSHRHAMLVDQTTNNIHIPLNNLFEGQTAFLEIANSILSEEAVLGYEYGMSIENPKNLVIWEAQFGDFFNGAQIILDTFISSGEAKWLWSSGLVLILPHGYEGAGPEHSSARIERFLQLTDSKENDVDSDNVNLQVCQPSTPAQYFHLLRRQMVRDFRKPLVVISPKVLLKSADAISSLSEMAPKTSFLPVIGESVPQPSKIRRVLLTAGQHYYGLKDKRRQLGIKDTVIIRLESYCPFPVLQLQNEINKYSNAKLFVWCQEEPQNMGAWAFVKPRFDNLIGKKIKYCGRPVQASPAVAIASLHQQQKIDTLTKPFTIEIDQE